MHEGTIADLRMRAPHAALRIAVLLGSGWSALADHVTGATRVPYSELAGFPSASVSGHRGELVLGRIGSREVAVMSAPKHAYEDGDVNAMKAPIYALAAIGCGILVQTNAAGSLDEKMPPGSLMLVSDHINWPQLSPLVGESGPERFVDMADAYDSQLRGRALAVAKRGGVALHEGTYMWCLGPQFETPAEVRACRLLGADAVGMSTVPETILARRAGMKVIAFSLMTNMAAGLSRERISHSHTLEQAGRASATASRLLADVIEEIGA